MYNMRKEIIFCLLLMINAANVQSTRVKADQATREYAIELINPVTVEQALPVIFIAIPENEDLQPVTGLAVAEIISGRLVSGTIFYSRTSIRVEQKYFCPDPDSDETCLVPQNFPTSQILECAREPKPVLQPFPGEYHCGANNMGILLSFNYDMCPPTAPYNYTSQSPSIYMICYDGSRSKNLYVSYTMYGASMLKENLLISEREMPISINDESYGYIDPDYNFKLRFERDNFRKCVLQTLVPPEDMPLATQRKATHYFANYALQNGDLVGLWDGIRKNIRDHAANMTTQILTIKTGVFDIPLRQFPTITSDGEMPNIWVTLITTKVGNWQTGLAILMNNFTMPGNIPPPSQYYIDYLCDNKNSCVPSLHEQFVNKKGEVRCCSPTNQIMNLFYHNYPGSQSLAPLLINGINYEPRNINMDN